MTFTFVSAGAQAATAANRFGVDYRLEAARLPAPPCPIIDVHAHVNGAGAAPIWRDVADLFGIRRVHTMVRLADAPRVRDILGDRVRFIAFPDFRAERRPAMTEGFLADIQAFHDGFGAKIVKLWNAPRMREFFPGAAGDDIVPFDSPWRVRHAQLAESLGMGFMVHVADPDTWFGTRYGDVAMYGAKIDQYRSLRVMLDRFKGPWIAAHMGGWPEDLAFLSTLLESHPNLYLDTSATKWIVREISLHPAPAAREFFQRWRGRILFGSDVVTTDEHLAPKPPDPKNHPMADLADSPAAAFDLYASRYWALRTLWETDYDAESPIADPDLAMVNPAQYGQMSAPRLRGLSLPADLLRVMYHDAAAALFASLGEPLTAPARADPAASRTTTGS
ncbi:MAG: hypothetical protein SFY69_09280 [Planctomycetota bacterium]|nr:hypothetical protein [Planctomycetota bacterium]